jgi:hypothetical protein
MHATYHTLVAPSVSEAGHGVLAADLDAVLTSHPIRNGLLRTADKTTFEREIDQHVYALYGLTPEEIAIVEDFAK